MSGSSSEPAPPSRSNCPTCKAVFRGDYRRCPSDGAILIVSSDDPLVGSVLAERYQIEDVIGDGGIGRVYRARHVRMSRRFAIKVPFGEVGYDRKARARLANEADAASRLDHPNVIGVVDVGETPEGLFYLAMDLADGPSLGELLSDQLITPDEVVPILMQLCDGLAHAHDRGLVHRDLKPDNIVVTSDANGGPVPRVIDFGLALMDDAETKDRLTTAGLVMGTPHYMAPEQATGEVLDHRTDLFALGIIAFELLAGRMPFDGTPTEVARQNVGVLMPTIHERSGRLVEPLLEVLVMWLTRKSKLKRPDSARDVLTYLRKLQAGDREGARAMLPDSLRGATPRPLPAPGAATIVLAVPESSTAESWAVESAVEPRSLGGAESIAAARSIAIAESVGDTAESAIVQPVVRELSVPRTEPVRELDDVPPRARRWPWLIAAALLVAAIVALIAWPRGGRGTPAAATAPIDAGVAIDAAELAVLPMLDAAEPPLVVDAAERSTPTVRTTPIDAATAVVRTAPVDAAPAVVRTVPVDAAPAVVRTVPVDAGPPPPDVEGLSLKALYGQVARQLDDAVLRLGADRTAALRARFASVPPYLDAVRKPALRTDAETQLKALSREIAKLK